MVRQNRQLLWKQTNIETKHTAFMGTDRKWDKTYNCHGSRQTVGENIPFFWEQTDRQNIQMLSVGADRQWDKTYSSYGSRQTLTLPLDSVLCLMRMVHARFLSDTNTVEW